MAKGYRGSAQSLPTDVAKRVQLAIIGALRILHSLSSSACVSPARSGASGFSACEFFRVPFFFGCFSGPG